MVSDKDKGIFTVLHVVHLTADLMTHPLAAEYVESRSVDASIRARWQKTVQGGSRLLDWKLEELWLDGVSLSDHEMPPDFPIAPIGNACTISSLMRRRLEECHFGKDGSDAVA